MTARQPTYLKPDMLAHLRRRLQCRMRTVSMPSTMLRPPVPGEIPLSPAEVQHALRIGVITRTPEML